jgi:hypothetical protein
MKLPFILLLSVMTLVITGITNAQKNVVKIGGQSGINLGFERVLTERSSLQFSFTYRFPRVPPVYLVALFESDDNEDITLGSGKQTGFNMVLEYRLYNKTKGAPKGMYFGPYMKLNHKSVEFDYVENNFLCNVDGSYNAFSLGFQLGYQWILWDHVSLDFTFVGLGFSWNTVNGTYKSTDPTKDYVQKATDFNDGLDGIPIVESSVEAIGYANNKMTIKGGVPFLAFRIAISGGFAW